MADKNVNIKIKADGKEAEKGLNGITAKLNQMGKSLNQNKALSGFSKLGMAVTGLLGPLSLVTKGLKMAVSAVKDLNEASLKQIKAEKQLETAARNNPFLNKKSVTELKEYASQLQKVGTIGDEELIPMMARLASAGRTQSEIQKIMAAALDLSASGAMSMDSAVEALNKSLSGQVSGLEKVASGVKKLTKEQLEDGAAIDIVAKKYAGMAEETAKATGAGQQLNNAWGDLKEALGMGFTAAIMPIQRFFTWAINGVTSVVNGLNKILGIAKDTGAVKKSDVYLSQMESIDAEIKANQEKLDALKKQEENASDDIIKIYEEAQEKVAEYQKKRYKELSESEKEEYRNLRAYLRKNEGSYQDAIYRSQNAGSGGAVDTTKEQIELEAKLLEYQQKRAEAEKLYNEALENEKELIEDTVEEQEEKLDNSLIDKWLKKAKSEVEQIKEELELLRERKDLLEGKGLDSKAVEQAIQNCTDALEEAKVTEFYNKLQGVFSQIADITNKLAEGIQNAVSLAQDGVDTQTEYQTAQLNKRYEQGLISEQEYIKEKEKIEKESAQKSYEIEMWNWSSQILQATAQGALAVVNALATANNIYAGIAMAGLAATMTGVQMGALIAAKPIKPSFSTGGIVPGSSHIGGRDTTAANLSSREMVLTMAQQKHLLNIASGKAVGGGNTVINMPIENTASDVVNVSRVDTNDGYKLVIEKAVNAGLYDGSFNNGLKMAQSSFNGRNFTN